MEVFGAKVLLTSESQYFVRKRHNPAVGIMVGAPISGCILNGFHKLSDHGVKGEDEFDALVLEDSVWALAVKMHRVVVVATTEGTVSWRVVLELVETGALFIIRFVPLDLLLALEWGEVEGMPTYAVE
jgi:hypothetical protein